MYKEIGKWFLDVAKYIVTAYVLTTMFVKVDSIFAALGGNSHHGDTVCHRCLFLA